VDLLQLPGIRSRCALGHKKHLGIDGKSGAGGVHVTDERQPAKGTTIWSVRTQGELLSPEHYPSFSYDQLRVATWGRCFSPE